MPCISKPVYYSQAESIMGSLEEEEKAEIKQAGQRLRKLILAEETREEEALREAEEVTYEAGAF